MTQMTYSYWRCLLMENSQAYIDFTNQIKATGNQKMAGYKSKTLDEIFEWEREEVENLIWHNFCNKI